MVEILVEEEWSKTKNPSYGEIAKYFMTYFQEKKYKGRTNWFKLMLEDPCVVTGKTINRK
jgi:hypothetical protein